MALADEAADDDEVMDTVAPAGSDIATPASMSKRTPKRAEFLEIIRPLSGLRFSLPRRTNGRGCTSDTIGQSLRREFHQTLCNLEGRVYSAA